MKMKAMLCRTLGERNYFCESKHTFPNHKFSVPVEVGWVMKFRLNSSSCEVVCLQQQQQTLEERGQTAVQFSNGLNHSQPSETVYSNHMDLRRTCGQAKQASILQPNYRPTRRWWILSLPGECPDGLVRVFTVHLDGWVDAVHGEQARTDWIGHDHDEPRRRRE